MLRTLFEAGGRVIDSSPMYGRAEEVVGVLLKDMQALDKPFLATKVWTSGEEAGIRQMNELRSPRCRRRSTSCRCTTSSTGARI